MADELQLKAILDASGVVEGTNTVASSMKSMADQIAGSVEQINAGFSDLQSSQGKVGLSAELIGPAFKIATDAIQLHSEALEHLKGIEGNVAEGSVATIAAISGVAAAAEAQRTALVNLAAISNPSQASAINLAVEAQERYNVSLENQRIVAAATTEGSVAQISAIERVSAAYESVLVSRERLNILEEQGLEIVAKRTAQEQEALATSQGVAEAREESIVSDTPLALATEKAEELKASIQAVIAAQEEKILSDNEVNASIAGVTASQERLTVATDAYFEARAKFGSDPSSRNYIALGLALDVVSEKSEIAKVSQAELQAVIASGADAGANIGSGLIIGTSKAIISLEALEAKVAETVAALEAAAAKSDALKINTDLGKASTAPAPGNEAYIAAKENEVVATKAVIEAEQELDAARSASQASTTSEVAGIEQNIAAQQAEAEAVLSLAQAQENLTAVTARLKAANADSTISANEYIEIQREIAAAEEEVATARVAASEKVAQAKANLVAAQAEETEILSESNASWAEAAEARENVIVAEEELQTALQASGASLQANIVANEGFAASFAGDATVLAKVATVLEQLGTIATSVTASLGILSNANAVANISSQEYAVKLATINVALGRYNLALQGTAGSLKLVQAEQAATVASTETLSRAVSQATDSFGGMERGIGFATARMAATDVGASQLGYTFGLLGRTIPGVTAALNAIFIPILLITFAELISSWVDKFKNFEVELRKNADAFDELAVSAQRSADGIELQNLKLEDQILKLEGRPTTNRLTISLLEAKEAADQLDESLKKILSTELTDLQEHSIGLWDQIKVAIGSTFDQGIPKIVAGTKDIFPALEQPISNLKNAISIQEAARRAVKEAQDDVSSLGTAGTQAEQAAAQARLSSAKQDLERVSRDVEDARTKVRTEADALLTKTKADQGPSHALYGGLFALPSPDYTERIKVLNNLLLLIKDIGRAEEEEAKKAQQGTGKAKVENAEEAYTRTSQLALDTIKADESLEAKRIATAKSTAESISRIEEENAKYQILVAEGAGEKKAAAEEAAIPALRAAQETKNAAELDAYDKSLQNQISALEKQRAIYEQNPVEDKRVKLLQENDEALTKLTATSTEERNNIIRDGQLALEKLDIEDGAKRLESARANAKDVARVLREQEKLGFETGNLQLKGIEESIRSEERLYSLGERTRTAERAFLAEKLNILRAQEAVAEANIRTEIARELAQQGQKGAFAPNVSLVAQEPIAINSDSLKVNTSALSTNTAAILALPQKIEAAVSSAKPSIVATTPVTPPSPTQVATAAQQAAPSAITAPPQQAIPSLASTLPGRAAAGAVGITGGIGPEAAEIQSNYVRFIQQKIDQLQATGGSPADLADYQRQLKLATESLKKYTANSEVTPTTSATSTILSGVPSQLQPAAAPTPVTPSLEGADATGAYAGSINRVKELQEQLTATTERWKAAIDQVTVAYDKLDTSTATWLIKFDVQTKNEVATFLQQWQGALVTLNAGFASSFDAWLVHGTSFGRSMANVGLKMLTDFSNVFIKIGLQAAELQAVKGIRNLFGIGQALTPGAGLSTAVDQAPGVAGVTGNGLFGTAQTTATTSATTALTALTASANALTVSQTSQVPAVTATTTAHIVHAPAVHTSTLAHLEHAIAVIASTLAHIFHAIWVAIDTAAIQVAAAVKAAFAFIGLAGGGLVAGPGTGTSDSVPAMLSRGEFVMKAAAVEKVGVQNLHEMNKGTVSIKRQAFASGGLVGSVSSTIKNDTPFGGILGGGRATPAQQVAATTAPIPKFSNVNDSIRNLGPSLTTNDNHSVDSHDTHNFRVAYAPTFARGFSIDEHGPEIADYMRNMLRRAGYHV